MIFGIYSYIQRPVYAHLYFLKILDWLLTSACLCETVSIHQCCKQLYTMVSMHQWYKQLSTVFHISGYILDVSRSYIGVFIFMAVNFVAAGALMVAVHILTKRRALYSGGHCLKNLNKLKLSSFHTSLLIICTLFDEIKNNSKL